MANMKKKTGVYAEAILEYDGKPVVAVPMKKCGNCDEYKPLTEFYKNGKGYYQSYCKDCQIEYTKETRALRKRLKKSKEIKIIEYKARLEEVHHLMEAFIWPMYYENIAKRQNEIQFKLEKLAQ